MSFRIQIVSRKEEISVKKNDVLSDALIRAGIPLSIDCSKRGLCGKCFVRIMEGIAPPPSEKETFFLKMKNLDRKHRLACQFKVKSDLFIEIPESSLLENVPVLSSGPAVSVQMDPAVKKYFFMWKTKRMSTFKELAEYVKKKLGNRDLTISPFLLSHFERTLPDTKSGFTSVLYEDKELTAIESGDSTQNNFGLAIDIGTTTVAVEIVDLDSGKTLDHETALNEQTAFGADVISRIGHAYAGAAQQEELRSAIVSTLNKMAASLFKRNRIEPRSVYDVVVAGNTAMNHLFLGKPIHTLAVSPFNPAFTSLPAFSASEAGMQINGGAQIYITPNIKSFVGGDISAGLIASNFLSQEGNHLYIDLGTNGEIVLKTPDHVVTTSTAAGPAFEGMNINCGMLAVPGAIHKAVWSGKLEIFSIGNQAPIGICGTGLIDLLAILLDQGDIASSGKITSPDKKISISPSIFLLQKDIRELQLAVAAIKTGIQLILEEIRMTPADLDGLMIAGAFGTSLNVENAVRIGLLPKLPIQKITYLGNAALAGAKTLLLAHTLRRKAESFSREISFISLAENKQFQDVFIKSLEFKPF